MSDSATAGDRGTGLRPLSFLPKPLREPRRPALAIFTGWLTAFFPTIALAALVSFILPDAPQPEFNMNGPMALLLLVVFAPVMETLVMGSVLLVLMWLFGPAAAVILSAAGWGIAHSMAASSWGLVIWWPFLIFSTLFVTWRSRSLLAAFAIAAVVHGLHNLVPALVVASGYQP